MKEIEIIISESVKVYKKQLEENGLNKINFTILTGKILAMADLRAIIRNTNTLKETHNIIKEFNLEEYISIAK